MRDQYQTESKSQNYLFFCCCCCCCCCFFGMHLNRIAKVSSHTVGCLFLPIILYQYIYIYDLTYLAIYRYINFIKVVNQPFFLNQYRIIPEPGLERDVMFRQPPRRESTYRQEVPGPLSSQAWHGFRVD